MSAPQPIKLSTDDLYSAKVEGYLEHQDSLRAVTAEVPPQPLLQRVIYSSWFYLSLASGLGAFLAWAIVEPHFKEGARGDNLAAIMLFPTVAAMVGLFLGAAEGLMCRQLGRAALCAAVGAGVGLIGGFVALFAAGIVFVLMTRMAVSIGPPRHDGMPHGLGLLVFMMGRASAWAIAGLPAGLGQGLALREKRVVFNGVLGGVLGGLLGGLLFDPIDLLLTTDHTRASLSRAIGLTVIGLMVGLFVGLVEQWTKTAWLFMRTGPLAGKQFVLYRSPTVVGSSPKADIYLFKDPAIDPRHLLIHNRGGRFEVEDCGGPEGTHVNGIPIKKQFLRNGDQIVIGKTVLEFSLRESR